MRRKKAPLARGFVFSELKLADDDRATAGAPIVATVIATVVATVIRTTVVTAAAIAVTVATAVTELNADALRCGRRRSRHKGCTRDHGSNRNDSKFLEH